MDNSALFFKWVTTPSNTSCSKTGYFRRSPSGMGTAASFGFSLRYTQKATPHPRLFMSCRSLSYGFRSDFVIRCLFLFQLFHDRLVQIRAIDQPIHEVVPALTLGVCGWRVFVKYNIYFLDDSRVMKRTVHLSAQSFISFLAPSYHHDCQLYRHVSLDNWLNGNTIPGICGVPERKVKPD